MAVGKWGKVDFSQVEEFGDKLEQLAEDTRAAFFQSAARELAARLLAEAIQRTPVNKEGGGGTLRRGWTAGQDVSPTAFADALGVQQVGNDFVITVTNEVYYAVYVEYGHRTRKRKDGSRGFVEGQFMLKTAMETVDRNSRAVLEKKLEAWLRGVFD